jgi:hypothetical protein
MVRHILALSRGVLDNACCNRWTRPEGATARLPHSPDFSPVALCVWGHLRALVCAPVNDTEALQQHTVNGFHTIRNNSGIFERVRRSTIRWVQVCVEFHSGHSRPLLQMHKGSARGKESVCGPMFIRTSCIVLLCVNNPRKLYRPFKYIQIYTPYIFFVFCQVTSPLYKKIPNFFCILITFAFYVM